MQRSDSVCSTFVGSSIGCSASPWKCACGLQRSRSFLYGVMFFFCFVFYELEISKMLLQPSMKLDGQIGVLKGSRRLDLDGDLGFPPADREKTLEPKQWNKWEIEIWFQNDITHCQGAHLSSRLHDLNEVWGETARRRIVFFFVNLLKCRKINTRLNAGQLEMDIYYSVGPLSKHTHTHTTSRCSLTADNAVEIADSYFKLLQKGPPPPAFSSSSVCRWWVVMCC